VRWYADSRQAGSGMLELGDMGWRIGKLDMADLAELAIRRASSRAALIPA
jgi:hypothetical protein